MSRRKTVEPAEGPNPDRGGAFIRLPDGTLIRDESEEQHIPADELVPPGASDVPAEEPALPADSDAGSGE